MFHRVFESNAALVTGLIPGEVLFEASGCPTPNRCRWWLRYSPSPRAVAEPRRIVVWWTTWRWWDTGDTCLGWSKSDGLLAGGDRFYSCAG
jgi:hypothetical protein